MVRAWTLRPAPPRRAAAVGTGERYHSPKTLGLSRRRAVRPVQRRVALAACGERCHGTGACLRWVHRCGYLGSRRLFPSPKVAASAQSAVCALTHLPRQADLPAVAPGFAAPLPQALMERLPQTRDPFGRHTLPAVGDTGLSPVEPRPQAGALAAAPPDVAWDQYLMVRLPPALPVWGADARQKRSVCSVV